MSTNKSLENYLGHSEGYEFLRLNEQVVVTFEQSYDDVSSDKLEMIDILVYENYKSLKPKKSKMDKAPTNSTKWARFFCP